jgi:hypothetical protein
VGDWQYQKRWSTKPVIRAILEKLIQSEDARAMFQRNGCNQSVNGGQRDALATCQAVDRGRSAVRFSPFGLQHVPFAQKAFNSAGVPGNAL